MRDERNSFLDIIGRHFYAQRPNVPEGLNYTAHIEAIPEFSFYNFNLRSRGCRHSLSGGCTMCDYWVSRDLDPSRIVDFAREALESLDHVPGMLCMGPYGSMFDDWEVAPAARREIYRLMKAVGSSFYAVFTRFDTVTEDKIQELLEYFRPDEISVDLGLETADAWKRKYCVNKALGTEAILDALALLQHYGIFTTVYILLGVPFLSPAEMIEDTIDSILWSFDHGVNYAVVFPVHIKPWTVVRWLYEHRLYEPVSLWSVVEVLSRLPSELLKKVGLSWHNPRPERTHPLSPVSTIVPTTCPTCYDQVVRLLESYRFSLYRIETVVRAAAIECECKDSWRRQVATVPAMPLVVRVRDAYRQLGIDILGQEWWARYGESVLAGVPDCE